MERQLLPEEVQLLTKFLILMADIDVLRDETFQSVVRLLLDDS
jgi:hypothetical protein